MTNSSGITPSDMRVLIKPQPVEEKTQGGIILTANTLERDKYAQTRATFIAAGDNAFRDWGDCCRIPKPGDEVIMAQYSGKMHQGADGQDYRICNDEDVIGFWEGDAS